MREDDIILGLAAGDMLGAPMEFKTPDQVRRLYGEVAGPVKRSLGIFGPGEFTDDTQLALCLLSAYPADAGLLARALASMEDWLSRGPRDVGVLTRDALRSDGPAAWRASGYRSCGNGALMRAAASNAAGRAGADLLPDAVLLGALTHADPRSLAACAILCAGLEGLARDLPYRAAWEDALARTRALDIPALVLAPFGAAYAEEARARLPASLSEVETAVRKALAGAGGGNTGYAVTTLQTAVAHGGAASFAEGVLPIVRQGDDSDTVAAVAGAILGARGLTPPPGWLGDLRSGERFGAWPRDARGAEAVRRLREAGRRARGVVGEAEAREGYGADVPTFAVRRLTPQVLYGRNPLTPTEIGALAAAGVTHIVDLREEREWAAQGRLGREAVLACRTIAPGAGPSRTTAADARALLTPSDAAPEAPLRIHLPVADGGAPHPAVFPAAIAFIDAAVESGGTVFVHCRAGRERTGAILLAWWGHGRREGAVEAHGPSLAPLEHQRLAAGRFLRGA